jgi:hypothetical protein
MSPLNPEVVMPSLTRTFTPTPTGALRSALVLALALTPACGDPPAPPSPATTTTTITFNELMGNTMVGEQYLERGVEFVNGPLFPGYGAIRLPIVIENPAGGEPGNKLALIHPFQIAEPSADTNLLWGRLRRPAQRVEVRVRNIISSPVTVRLLVPNGSGGMRSDEQVVPVDPNANTTLTMEMGRPSITTFLVYARGGVIAVDDVTFDH